MIGFFISACHSELKRPLVLQVATYVSDPSMFIDGWSENPVSQVTVVVEPVVPNRIYKK